MHEVHAGPILRIARPGSLRGRPHRGAAVWQVKCQAKNFTLDFGENTVDRETTLAEIGHDSSVFVHVD
jgi:hypothetical protein